MFVEYKSKTRPFKLTKIREAELPMELIYNEAFDSLKRFDNTQNGVKVKPVVVSLHKGYK